MSAMPKPKPPVKKADPVITEKRPVKQSNKPFVRKPHLTQKPFLDSEAMLDLQRRMGTPYTKNAR